MAQRGSPVLVPYDFPICAIPTGRPQRKPATVAGVGEGPHLHGRVVLGGGDCPLGELRDFVSRSRGAEDSDLDVVGVVKEQHCVGWAVVDCGSLDSEIGEMVCPGLQVVSVSDR